MTTLKQKEETISNLSVLVPDQHVVFIVLESDDDRAGTNGGAPATGPRTDPKVSVLVDLAYL